MQLEPASPGQSWAAAGGQGWGGQKAAPCGGLEQKVWGRVGVLWLRGKGLVLSLLKAGTMACGDLGTVVAASPEAGPSLLLLLLLRGVCQGNTELPGSI